MVMGKIPDPAQAEKSQPEPELELTDEEKALDEEYQRQCQEHTAVLMRNVGAALQSCVGAPVVVIQRVRKDGTEYHAPAVLAALAAYLQSGPGPIDPLAHKVGHGGSGNYADLIRGITDALNGIVMTYVQQKSTPVGAPDFPKYPPGYEPPPPPSDEPVRKSPPEE